MRKFDAEGLGRAVVGIVLLAACSSSSGGSVNGEGHAGEVASAGVGGGAGGRVTVGGSAGKAAAGAPPAEGGGPHGEGGGPHGEGGGPHGDEHGGRAGADGGTGGSASDAGASGDAGADGVAGTPGAAGAAGDEGTGGNAGAAGEEGAAASSGTSGEPGAAGSSGVGGEAGAAGGAPGEAGASGVAGASGGEGGDDLPRIEREQAGGAPRAIATDTLHLYVGVGPRVVVHRVVRGTHIPVGLPFVGETAAFEGNVSALHVDGALLFVAEHDASRGAVHVLDVSDPARPELRHSVALAETDSRPSSLDADGDTLYVADERRGVFEIDLAATSGPAVVDSAVPDLRPNRLWLDGSTLYFARSGNTELSLGALDRDGLDLLGESTTVSMFPRHVALVAPNLLVSHGPLGTGLARVDDLNAAPSPLLSLPNLGGSGIVVAGPNLAWITRPDGVYTLDLSEPENVHHGNAFPLQSARAVAGAHAGWLLATLAADGETTLWEAEQPLAPRPFARASTTIPCASCGAFALHGDSLVVPRPESTRLWLSELELGGLRPLHVLATNAEEAVVEDVAVSGDRIAVADRNFGLHLFELGALPRALGSFARQASFAVALDERRAFLGGVGLTAVDLTNGDAPVHAATLSDSMLVRDLAVEGALLFVADDTPGLGALRILDTSSSTFDEVGSYAGCARPTSVSVDAGLALLGCGDHFELVDVSVPEEPAHVVSFTSSGRAVHAVLREGAAYLADAEGIRVVDVGGDEELAFIAAEGVVKLQVPGARRIVASLGEGGIRQWQL